MLRIKECWQSTLTLAVQQLGCWPDWVFCCAVTLYSIPPYMTLSSIYATIPSHGGRLLECTTSADPCHSVVLRCCRSIPWQPGSAAEQGPFKLFTWFLSASTPAAVMSSAGVGLPTANFPDDYDQYTAYRFLYHLDKFMYGWRNLLVFYLAM